MAISTVCNGDNYLYVYVDKEDERVNGFLSQKKPREVKEGPSKKKERADGPSSHKRHKDSEEEEGPSKKKKEQITFQARRDVEKVKRKKVLQRKNVL